MEKVGKGQQRGLLRLRRPRTAPLGGMVGRVQMKRLRRTLVIKKRRRRRRQIPEL